MKPKSIEHLKRLQLEDAEGGISDPDAHAGELLAGRRWRRLSVWFSRRLDVWTTRFERIGKWLKAIATALGSLAAIIALIRALRTRDSVPPRLPPPTGAPSTALDFPVTRGRPPDGGH